MRHGYDSTSTVKEIVRHAGDFSGLSRALAENRNRIVSMYLFITLLHVAALGSVMALGHHNPELFSIGVLAYLFGLRHAVDADHITAIDNTTRKLLHEGKQPLGVGFFFSLGHSTIVLLLTVGITSAVRTVLHAFPGPGSLGSVLGTVVSAGFLYLIAALNFSVLRGIVTAYKNVRQGRSSGVVYTEGELDEMLLRRGLLSRLFRAVFRVIEQSWQMYFVGFLFGLGFDTASETALLGVASSTAAHGTPLVEVLLFPLLFAAGMSLIDTTDGVFMCYAYKWAFRSPERKLHYNFTVTSVSILVAFFVGTAEWLQVVGTQFKASGAVRTWVQNLDFETLGYSIIVLFAVIWLIAWIVLRVRGARWWSRWNILSNRETI
jgi:high-affinity nickel-transport protein